MADTFSFDGSPVRFSPGQTVAAALWATGIRSWGRTRVNGAPRGIFCGIGACHDCLATVDGATARLCVTPASPGATVTPGIAAVRSAGLPGDRKVSVPPHDLVVVGAGPAGLAAAATAGLAGLRVALLDAAPRLGGQFWRHRDGETGVRGYRGWRVFTGLRSVIEERVDHVRGASVWFAAPGFQLHTRDAIYRAPRVLVATGAHDRVVPFPGWDLPGVVTAGAAQALLKGSGVAAGARVVVAGAGPFLLPVAVGLAEAGVRVVEVIEAGDPRSYLRGGLAALASHLPEAAGYLARLARHRVPYRPRHAVIAAHPGPDGVVSSVDVAAVHGRRQVRRVACDALAVGYGFTANLELALALGCRTRLGADGGLALVVDADGQTTEPGVHAAGEVTGVGGSALAIVEGRLAGDAIARAAGAGPVLSPRQRAAAQRQRDRLRAFADVMHRAHPAPAGWPERLEPSIVVCRCEEVPAGGIERAVRELGASDGRGVKLFARPGMGWCQGRTCGPATAALTARACGRPVTAEDLLAFAHRPFALPVRLADLASLDDASTVDTPLQPE